MWRTSRVCIPANPDPRGGQRDRESDAPPSLAWRGFGITCIEPGPALAAVARNLAGLDAEVVQARFEDWDPVGQL